MKKFMVIILLLAVGIIGRISNNALADESSISVHSGNYGGVDYTDGFSLFFEAGDYKFTPLSGAWNDNNGLPNYWMWNVNIYQQSTGDHMLGDNTIYSSASAALSNNLSDEALITISNTAGEYLWFYIYDTGAGNNSGSVTIGVTQTSSPSGSPPIVPEPVSSILFIIGSAVFAGRAYLRKKILKASKNKEVN